jgi:hypothetical protein
MSLALLVSESATTGWADWIHGELWLLPDRGLLRRRLGIGATLRHFNRQTVDPAAVARADIPDADLGVIAAEHRTNVFVPKERMVRARLHAGLSTGRLSLDLEDQNTVKLLWLKPDHAERALEPVLRQWIGDAVEHA